MASPTPTQLTISYGTSSQQTLPIRAGEDFNNAVRNIFLYGGFWFVSSTGIETFVPRNAITGITAQ
jgi:hypothetical protein